LDGFFLDLIRKGVYILVMFVEGGLVDHGLFAQVVDPDLFKRVIFAQLDESRANAVPGFNDSQIYETPCYPTVPNNG
jgi:hypothetical protein